MKWFRIHNFYESWRPVYNVSRFFCLTTVTNNFVDRTPVRTSTDHTMLIVGILMCALLSYNSYELYQEQKFTLTESHLISAGNFAYIALFVLSVISALILNYFYGFRAAKFSDIIHKTDQQLLTHFDHHWNYQKEHFQIVVYIISGYLLLMVFIQLLSQSSTPFSQFQPLQLLRLVSAYFWVTGCYQTLAATTLLQLIIMSRRFAVFNAKMEIYLTRTDKLNNPRRKIRQFALMHARLSDAIRLFNTCFSKQITFAMGCGFLFNVFAIFSLIHAYAAVSADSVTFSVARSSMIFSGFFQSFIFQLIVYSNRLNNEVSVSELHYWPIHPILRQLQCKRCGVIVHKAVNYGRHDRKIVRECDLFSLQLMHHSPSVSSGLFDFDWTLCYTMIGSLTTNLVILLQFDFVNFRIYAESNLKET